MQDANAAVSDSEAGKEAEELESTLCDFEDEVGAVSGAARDLGGNMAVTIPVASFEELVLPEDVIEDMRTVWSGFLDLMQTPLAAGEAIYSAIFEVAPSLQAFFKTPRAVQAMKFMNALALTGSLLDNPPALKTAIETLGFHHLNIEVTEPRVSVYREAIVDLLSSELEMPDTAKYGWAVALNWIGGAFIFIRNEYKGRLDTLASSWALVRDVGDAGREKDAPEAGAAAEKGELDLQIVQKVPTNFHEMFLFNAAVMGYGHRRWMADVLTSFDAIVTHCGDRKRLQDECQVLAIVLGYHKGSIHLSEFSAVMMASLRSLLPQTWSSEHETAWSWMWTNVTNVLKGSLGLPAKQRKTLEGFYSKISDETMRTFRMDIYRTFFAKCATGQDYFKQSSTRLHFIVDKIIALTVGIYVDPKKIIDEISALGLRHVGYGIPVDLFGPFVTSCIEVLAQMTKDLQVEEAFRWSLGLVSGVLVRTIEEGSTIVMRAINENCATALRKAVSCAPRGERARWVLKIQVGSQSISPLMWAVRSGATEATQAILKDLLTIRADRDSYYYAVDDLFQRHPEIIDSLCVNAPMLLPTLLDGLIWRACNTQDGERRVHYYIKNLVVDSTHGGLSRSLARLVEFGDPKIICHPAVLLALNLIWSGVSCGTFLWSKLWFLFSLVTFVVCQALLEPAEVALAHSYQPSNVPRVVSIVVGRVIIYIFILGRLLYHHASYLLRDARSGSLVRYFGVPVPQYLTRWYEVAGFLLCVVVTSMLTTEPILLCLGSEEFASHTGMDKMSYVMHCDQIHGENHHRYYRYTILSMLAVMLYFALILDMHSFSERLSAFALVCGRISRELLLHLCAFGFLVLSFSCGIASLGHSSEDFNHLQDGAVHLVRLALGLWASHEFQALETDPLLLTMVVLFVLLCTVFLVNVLIAQLNMAYSHTYADMLGYARLCRGRIILEVAETCKPARWERFVQSLQFDQPLEFNEGDLGPSGGIAMTEPAMDHPVTKDSILRFGGTTDPTASWPEPKEKSSESDRLERLEKALFKAMRRMEKLAGLSIGGSEQSGIPSGSSWGQDSQQSAASRDD